MDGRSGDGRFPDGSAGPPGPADRGGDPVAQALDGATGDYAVSGDAMRWSPELAGEAAPGSSRSGAKGAPGVGFAGLDVATGLGTVLGLDGAGVRRLVSSALFSLTAAAGDVVTELRQLTRGAPAVDDDC